MPPFTAQFPFFSKNGLSLNVDRYEAVDVSITAQIAFTLASVGISLNGAPAIAFSGLPSGFKIISMSFQKVGDGASPNDAAGYVRRNDAANSATASATCGIYSGSATATVLGTRFPIDVTFTSPFNPTSLLASLVINFVLTRVNPDVLLECAAWKDMELSGIYIIESFTWAVSVVGSTIHITSDGITPDLTTVENITLSYDNSGAEIIDVDDSKFTTKTATLIVFPIPEFCTFSGDVLLSCTRSGTTTISVIGSVGV